MHDRDLRALYRAARRRDADAVPDFTATVARARGRQRPRRRRGLVAALAIAGGLVAVLVLRGREPAMPAGPVDLAAMRWRAPTDFLLSTPNADLLRTVPTITDVRTAPETTATDTGGSP